MILLLTDRPETAELIEKSLSNEGFTVTVSPDYRNALVTLNSQQHFDLILLDFEYSSQNGNQDVFDICQKLKRNNNTRLIPLIGILDKNRFVEQLLAFEMGVDDFLLLPFTDLEIQLKIRSIQRMIDMQNQIRKKDSQLENLKNIQRIMVTLNHYINNALTPLYFAVQMMDSPNEDGQDAAGDMIRLKDIARDTVEFISKVLQSLHRIVQTGKIKVLNEGVYKDIMFDIEQELDQLIEKTRQ